MNCDACRSDRVFALSAKSRDCSDWSYRGNEGSGYAPIVANICAGDYIRVRICLECGKTQGKFPMQSDSLDFDPETEAKQYFRDNYGYEEGSKFFLGRISPCSLSDDKGFRFGHDLPQEEHFAFLIDTPHVGAKHTYVFIRFDSDRQPHMFERYFRFKPRNLDVIELNQG